ncbi:hypothetical protein [Micromonospora echinofusca]|uniref:Uncharacterized protein n=1 Tax=Micromonospora echinofusca TaxID=47858 RepID=A0ABS3VJ61_MICEH|nr:hypothetical protein [Micromonospora echinofusca]MBO4204563.1 hypothetical protein [Micromonospora echinofusca]
MQTSLAMVLPVAALWSVAGVLADRLPGLDRARTLRHRTGWLLGLVLAALAGTATVVAAGLGTTDLTPADRAGAALAVPAIPAAVVALSTLRRLGRIRAGAGAFAAAPGTPAPPSLRIGAAHPMIGLPVQVTALFCALALIPASRPGAALTTGPGGLVLSLLAVGVLAIGVRHALRHSRLTELAAPAGAASPPATGALHV